jgi:hypothetical protein
MCSFNSPYSSPPPRPTALKYKEIKKLHGTKSPQNIVLEIFDSPLHYLPVTEAQSTLQYSQNSITGLHPERFESGIPLHKLL